MANTVRSSISVPLDLKARMDAIGEPINWSTVCCRAIEQKLAEIAKKRNIDGFKHELVSVCYAAQAE